MTEKGYSSADVGDADDGDYGDGEDDDVTVMMLVLTAAHPEVDQPVWGPPQMRRYDKYKMCY